jgi:anti-sigma factor RsiW
MDPIADDNLAEYLTAWTQGELDTDQADRLHAYLRANPGAAGKLDQSLRLAAEARRALVALAPPATAELRDRVAALANRSTGRPSSIKIFRSPASRAWAAAVLVAVGIGLIVGHAMTRPAIVSQTTAEVIPAEIVQRVGRIHGECARVADRLHANGYPTDTTALQSDVEADFHTDLPHPDLSSVGFRYIGAGPCGDTLPNTVHLLYKSLRPTSIAAVSLFVGPYHGQYPIDPGRVYTASDDRDPFPMLVWRTDKVVYFLLADDTATAKEVAAKIAGH